MTTSSIAQPASATSLSINPDISHFLRVQMSKAVRLSSRSVPSLTHGTMGWKSASIMQRPAASFSRSRYSRFDTCPRTHRSGSGVRSLQSPQPTHVYDQWQCHIGHSAVVLHVRPGPKKLPLPALSPPHLLAPSSTCALLTRALEGCLGSYARQPQLDSSRLPRSYRAAADRAAAAVVVVVWRGRGRATACPPPAETWPAQRHTDSRSGCISIRRHSPASWCCVVPVVLPGGDVSEVSAPGVAVVEQVQQLVEQEAAPEVRQRLSRHLRTQISVSPPPC